MSNTSAQISSNTNNHYIMKWTLAQIDIQS